MKKAVRILALAAVWLAFSPHLSGQISIAGVTTSATQAILQYTSPVAQACSLQVADMNRSLVIASAAQTGGQVTVQTPTPHGLLAGTVIYLENSGGWNGWQVITSVPSSVSFIFASGATGGSPGGNAGVLVDDVNPALFANANSDSRPGNIVTGATSTDGQLLPLAAQAPRSRTFVVGKRTAELGLDGNRYSRALQAYSRHHFTLTCGTQTFDQDFRTNNLPLGDTYNEGPPVDRNNPGQYAYPTVQWPNQAQSLIDPSTGLRSTRVTGPRGAASTPQNFVTAIDAQSAWINPSAPLNNYGGAATFNGACSFGNCPLLLRADTLSLPGGASYAVGGNSLDWVTVTLNQASIDSGCSGDDCKIVVCLTISGVSCASGNLEASLSQSPANFTFGSGNLMDLWQGVGPPRITSVDVSAATGTVNYSAATRHLSLAGGNAFNTNWTGGSAITVAGGHYTIASVQNGRLLTLTAGPPSDVAGVSYSANNFGVLIWKKTAAPGRVSIGYSTYQLASTSNAGWPAWAINSCSNTVMVGGAPGYNCFIGQELYWISADGSSVQDLGLIATSYFGDGKFPQGGGCGNSGQHGQFDPQNGDIWYCLTTPYFDFSRVTITQAHYIGPHTQNTPGQQLPDCANNNGVQPCVTFTLMQPDRSQSVSQAAPSFNPDFATSGYNVRNWLQGGISQDGDMEIFGNNNQDTPGWMFIYTLGDRTPAGTSSNSIHMIAAASTYLHPPMSWCTIHDDFVPDGGWTGILSNSFSYMGPAFTPTMTTTGAPLNVSTGVAGGLNACPPNPLGVTGSVCTAITVTGEPSSPSSYGSLPPLQVGDLILNGPEYLRVVSIAGPTQFTAQRGYVSAPAAQSGTALTMACGSHNMNNAMLALWNYRNDPFGLNANYTTITEDPTILNAHNFTGGGVSVTTGGSAGQLGSSVCPVGHVCYQARVGSLYGASQSAQLGIVNDPTFFGMQGYGSGNGVDSHPGTCWNGWCMDAHPMDGGQPGVTLGNTSPFVNVAGQLWKVSGAQSLLNRKFLSTLAYQGRSPLVDISGPASVIGTGAPDSYKYCYALVAGECYSGSAAGDVYVNAPYVDYPYCNFPGVAIQPDDFSSICLADLGPYTGDISQFALNQDWLGGHSRRLGAFYARWNMMDVFWNTIAMPSGSAMASRVRWLDGVRSDDLLTLLPPMPNPDAVTRSGFVPISLSITPPPGLPVAGVIVEFGYVENGGAGSYYCTSRQETCVATAAAMSSSPPFYYEQTESYSPAACSTGCTITIPALAQHALYYRWKYFSAGGQVIETSQAHVVITP